MASNNVLRSATVFGMVALLLAGCAGANDEDSSSELVQITVADNPAAQNAPLYLGIEDGIFEEHGLDVEVVHQSDIAAIISGTASGQYDFGSATAVHVINANLNDIEIRAVSTVNGRTQPDEGPEAGNTLLAGPDSGIASTADLAGKTVAVLGLASLNTFTLFELADRAGVDPSSITLVQIPFGQMPAALASGDVDAAVIQSPFTAEAMADGSTLIAKPNAEVFPDMAILFFNTTQSYIDSNPEVVQSFSDAMLEAQAAAAANVERAQQTLVTYLDLTEEAARESAWTTKGDKRVELEGLALAQELLTRYNDQKRTVDVADLVWPGALETD
ncbi:ABC transporter substrate-binding protein [Microbacterium sp.]|uniref:ABC transporter substrate-binding protein n=1 Tax=Microbacterium sp. TaxID=51671 RepID=UPI003F990B94